MKKDILLWPLQNDPKRKRILVKNKNEVGYLWDIQILPEWWVCFSPVKLWELWFIGNWRINKWPDREDHITFHNTWRVHIWKKSVIFDYGTHWRDKRKYGLSKRVSIWAHNPQLLFSLKVPNLRFLEEESLAREWDVVLEITNGYECLLFTCWIFDWKSLNDVLKTWIDLFWLIKIPSRNSLNTFKLWFWEFKDISKTVDISQPNDGTKCLFLVIRTYEKSWIDYIDKFPYLFSVSEYNPGWSNPY